jgi:hypothetical protein
LAKHALIFKNEKTNISFNSRLFFKIKLTINKNKLKRTKNHQELILYLKIFYNYLDLTDQIFIELSSEALAKSPFCKTVNALTQSVCPFKVLFNVP